VGPAWWKLDLVYSRHTQNNWRLGQRHGLQNTTLTSYFSKNIYQKVIYVYFHKSIFQDKSIHIIFTFSNSTTWELFMIYILKVWLKPCPKRQLFWVRREYKRIMVHYFRLDKMDQATMSCQRCSLDTRRLEYELIYWPCLIPFVADFWQSHLNENSITSLYCSR